MKSVKGAFPILAFLIGTTLSAQSVYAEMIMFFQTTGYEIYNCENLQSIDQNHECTLAGTINCTINGNNCYQYQYRCMEEGSLGLLKRYP